MSYSLFILKIVTHNLSKPASLYFLTSSASNLHSESMACTSECGINCGKWVWVSIAIDGTAPELALEGASFAINFKTGSLKVKSGLYLLTSFSVKL